MFVVVTHDRPPAQLAPRIVNDDSREAPPIVGGANGMGWDKKSWNVLFVPSLLPFSFLFFFFPHKCFFNLSHLLTLTLGAPHKARALCRRVMTSLVSSCCHLSNGSLFQAPSEYGVRDM